VSAQESRVRWRVATARSELDTALRTVTDAWPADLPANALVIEMLAEHAEACHQLMASWAAASDPDLPACLLHGQVYCWLCDPDDPGQWEPA
jgi:hypothetical protein